MSNHCLSNAIKPAYNCQVKPQVNMYLCTNYYFCIMHLTRQQLNDLGAKLKEGVPEIRFAYLFGSSASGKNKETSDIDIAVYLDDEIKKIDVISNIIGIAEKVLPQHLIDLIILNDAGVIISMEVLKGLLLFIRDDSNDLHAGFYTNTCRKYEDHIILLKKQLKYRGHEVQWCD